MKRKKKHFRIPFPLPLPSHSAAEDRKRSIEQKVTE